MVVLTIIIVKALLVILWQLLSAITKQEKEAAWVFAFLALVYVGFLSRAVCELTEWC